MLAGRALDRPQEAAEAQVSNCLIYALLKLYREGGYVLMRKSFYGWWPHFLHMSATGEVTHFSPEKKRRRFFPPLLFRGRIYHGDERQNQGE